MNLEKGEEEKRGVQTIGRDPRGTDPPPHRYRPTEESVRVGTGTILNRRLLLSLLFSLFVPS
jgi:hypothetical protein